MDLIGALVNYFNTGSDANALALQALVAPGKMTAYYFWTIKDAPYVVVSRSNFDKLAEGTDNSFRIDAYTVKCEVFAKTSQQAEDVLEALENAYIKLSGLDIDNRAQLGQGEIDDHLTEWLVDHWLGHLNVTYSIVKSPQ